MAGKKISDFTAKEIPDVTDKIELETAAGNSRQSSVGGLADLIIGLGQFNGPLEGGLISGGQVVWETGYNFRVSAAEYVIGGVVYNSAEQVVTLDAADGTNDRIDVIYVNTSGVADSITGFAAVLPSEPDIDAATQLKLTFVFVQALSTSPVGVGNTNIYLENAEWTSSISGSGFNANSSTTPYAGTKCVEGTSIANNAYVQLQAPAPLTLDGQAVLAMFIRSKAAWNTSRSLRAQFFLDGVAKGSPVTIASGYWGFNSATLGAYQLVAIPLAQFVVPAGTQINQLRITGSGGAIGFFIDNIILQAQTGITQGGSEYLTQAQADAKFQPLAQVNRSVSFQIVGTTPSANEVLLAFVPAGGETITFADDFVGSTAKAATGSVNPASSYSMPVKKNGSVVGAIAISSGGVVTFSTTGGALTITSADLLEVLGNATPSVAVGFTFTLRGAVIVA